VRTCVVVVTAPAGPGAADVFQILATDTAPVAADTGPRGNVLSEGYTGVTVSVGAVNAASVALTSVIGKLAAVKPVCSVWAAPGQTANVVAGIVADDIDGGQIFGQPSAYANPLTFADGLTPSPFVYPSANPPANDGVPPPATPGPVFATISYLAPTTGVAGTAATVTVSTVEPDFLPAPAVPPTTTFGLVSMVVSLGGPPGVPTGSLNLVGGTETLVTINEPAAASFTVSDNAATAVTLLNAAGTAPLLPGSSIQATNGTASFVVSAVRATAAGAVITITDANGTVATLPLVVT
jgi:hypothetical protein